GVGNGKKTLLPAPRSPLPTPDNFRRRFFNNGYSSDADSQRHGDHSQRRAAQGRRLSSSHSRQPPRDGADKVTQFEVRRDTRAPLPFDRRRRTRRARPARDELSV